MSRSDATSPLGLALCSAVVVVFCLAFVLSSALADSTYAITDLGPGNAFGINASGQVVGHDTTTGQACLFSGGSVQDLGGSNSYAYGINASGQVVGYDTATNRAFLYSGGSMQDLGDLGGGQSGAYGINTSGQITGYSFLFGGGYDAFLSSGGGPLQDINTYPGSNWLWSWANCINDSGQVAGYGLDPTLGYRAFLYSGGPMQELGTLGGSQSIANGINASGQVVGLSNLNGNSPFDAFLYSGVPGSGGGMADLGTLGGAWGNAWAINDAGQVVGDSTTAGGADDAFLWTSKGGMQDLNGLIPSNSGWTLQYATAVNNAGQIVGWGIGPDGQTDAFELTPTTPELPPAALLATLPLGLAWLRRRRTR